MSVLLISPAEQAALSALRARAIANPFDVHAIARLLQTEAGRAKYFADLRKLSVEIPQGFRAVFSMETGHPAGLVRHLSVSLDNGEKLPSVEAVWMIAAALGFRGDMATCAVWGEGEAGDKPPGRVRAINVAQPVMEN